MTYAVHDDRFPGKPGRVGKNTNKSQKFSERFFPPSLLDAVEIGQSGLLAKVW